MNVLKQSILKMSVRTMSSLPAGTFLPVSQVTERVLNVVRLIPSCPESLDTSSYFVKDLGFDSLQRRELNKLLGEEFCVKLDGKITNGFISVESAVDYFAAHPKAR